MIYLFIYQLLLLVGNYCVVQLPQC